MTELALPKLVIPCILATQSIVLFQRSISSSSVWIVVYSTSYHGRLELGGAGGRSRLLVIQGVRLVVSCKCVC
ncbi:hypothetical protein EI94DRAFT_1739232 [Lactarius quietus]|nr:hypothetical protein EI94DRAFT_1739232 [Lactarius quietus]